MYQASYTVRLVNYYLWIIVIIVHCYCLYNTVMLKWFGLGIVTLTNGLLDNQYTTRLLSLTNSYRLDKPVTINRN